MSDDHSIAIAECGFPDRYPTALTKLNLTITTDPAIRIFAITILIATSIARAGALPWSSFPSFLF